MYKLFIISPHFPPSALPPSQRVRLMLKYCKKLGFKTTIFTTYSKYREEKNDEWLKELVGNEFDLIKLKSLNQKITRKFKFGDMGLRFIPFLFFRLLKECKKQKPDFIIYPVPPWYLLLIAPIVKKITGVKYAIDFIDPWVSPISKEQQHLKKKITHFIAKNLEFWVVKNATYIYSVSDQINEDIINRHPKLKNKIYKAIPYGVEISDFNHIEAKKNDNKKLQLSYIGAVWQPALPVIEQLLKSIQKINLEYPLKVNFTGTSYAGEGLAKKSLNSLIEKYNLENIVNEDPNRVTYKEAMKLTISADLLFLFGDMTKQYAASKLMGLVASQKPFFAFLHRESFPFKFLESVNYKYLVGYSDNENDLPSNNFDNLVEIIFDLIKNLDTFQGISLKNEHFLKHTAESMSINILTPVKEIIDNDKSLRKN